MTGIPKVYNLGLDDFTLIEIKKEDLSQLAFLYLHLHTFRILSKATLSNPNTYLLSLCDYNPIIYLLYRRYCAYQLFSHINLRSPRVNAGY